MKYFKRVYKLDIGVPGNIFTVDGFPSRDIRSPAQIRFTITQSANIGYSIAEITVFGLSRDRRKHIADRVRFHYDKQRADPNYKDFEPVTLVAGWQEGFGLIFNGQINNVEFGRDGPESTFKMFCQSSAKQWRNAYINRSFGPGTPQINIISAVAETLGTSVQFVGDFSKLPRAIKGRTLSQDSKSAMDELARSFEFEWMSENGRIIVVKDGAVRTDSSVHVYTPITGLVGSPIITDRGVDAEVLLNPYIRPWDQFEIKATAAKVNFSGIYNTTRIEPSAKGIHDVLSLVHEGDFYGDTWKTKIIGVRPLAA